MKFSLLALTLAVSSHNFSPVDGFSTTRTPGISSSPMTLFGYLDDLSAELKQPDSNPVPEEESREANKMAKEDIDRAGPGSWDTYVEFDEFDGGDGQMGVAGDGNKGLEKFGDDYQATVVNKQNADLQQVRQAPASGRG